MLLTLIKSRYFEKKCFWLRKKNSYLNNAYNKAHNINITTHDDFLSEEKQRSYQIAQASLATLIAASKIKKDKESAANKMLPKKIWLYWNAPLTSAPEIIKESLNSWTKMNPGYEVTYLTDENINKELGFDFNAAFQLASVNLGLALKADILRLYLLAAHGGIWADTTTLCLKPLDTWLLADLEELNFYAFRHKSNKTRPIEVWFLAAEPGSWIIKNTLSLFIKHVFLSRDCSLYLSNNLKKLGLSHSDSELFYSSVVNKAERFNFMPYFSLAYFFNTSLNLNGVTNSFFKLQNTSNNSSVISDGYKKMTLSNVAKQTYKKDYMESKQYRKTIEFVKNRLTQF